MTLSLSIDSRRHEGWTSATVTRALDSISGAFRCRLTERYPGEATPRDIRPGAPCRVALDGEDVISGHIDTVRVNYDADNHAIEASGRDATGHLVDCSAATSPGEWHDAKLEEIAAALAKDFGVEVRAEVDTGKPFARFRIEEGESVFEAIERACSFRGLLPLADVGGLALGRPARSRSQTVLRRGENILSATGQTSLLDRHSVYKLLGQQPGSDFRGAADAAHVVGIAADGGVRLHRPLTLVAEQGLDTGEAQTRVEWEASVRAARARRVTIAVQGWREAPGGPLWAPGRLVRVADDWLGLDRELLIVAVQQSIDEGGTITRMTLMPSTAFLARVTPEPEPDETGLWK